MKLDNVYISDMVKRDEINSNTGNVNTIKQFKTINATAEEINEIFKISKETHGLSPYDIINFIIIKLMKNKAIITKQEAINACKALKDNPNTRIPISEIDNIIKEFEKDSVTC